jgi:transposase InsO family protein
MSQRDASKKTSSKATERAVLGGAKTSATAVPGRSRRRTVAEKRDTVVRLLSGRAAADRLARQCRVLQETLLARLEAAPAGIESALASSDGRCEPDYALKFENCPLHETRGPARVDRALTIRAMREWNQQEPSFSAHPVASINLQTDVGKGTGKRARAVFGSSRQAHFAERRSTRIAAKAGRESNAPPGKPTWASAESVLAAVLVIGESRAAWGVSRVRVTPPRAAYSRRVSHKRVYALTTAHGVTLASDAPRVVEHRRDLVVEALNRLWVTDVMKVYAQQDGMVAVVPIIDCGCRSVLALEVTKSHDAPEILAAVRHALAMESGDPRGVPHSLDLRTDHWPQHTGNDCESLLSDWGISHGMEPVGHPTGNAVAKRLVRAMEEEGIWRRDRRSLAELRASADVEPADFQRAKCLDAGGTVRDVVDFGTRLLPNERFAHRRGDRSQAESVSSAGPFESKDLIRTAPGRPLRSNGRPARIARMYCVGARWLWKLSRPGFTRG